MNPEWTVKINSTKVRAHNMLFNRWSDQLFIVLTYKNPTLMKKVAIQILDQNIIFQISLVISMDVKYMPIEQKD